MVGYYENTVFLFVLEIKVLEYINHKHKYCMNTSQNSKTFPLVSPG